MTPRYVGINIPISLAEALDQIVEKEGIYGTRASLAKHILQNWIEGYRRQHGS